MVHTHTHTHRFYLVFALLIILFSSCQQLDIDSPIEPATKVAKLSLDSINYNVSLKSAKYLVQSSERDEKIQNIEPLVFQGDTLMYIFNFDTGWIVVSGDKRTEPFLASDETGSLSIKDLVNPGIATWLSSKADEIRLLKEANPSVEYNEGIELWVLIDKATNLSEENLLKSREKYNAIHNEVLDKSTRLAIPNGYVWVRRLLSVTTSPQTISAQKGPLLKTKWGQGDPWNTDVPYAMKNNSWVKCPTGCVAVAMSQILYNTHYRIGKPNGLYHTVSSTGHIYNDKNYTVRFSRDNYSPNSNRWDLMKINFMHYNGNASYVGDLMADVGERVGMKYGADGSGANVSKGAFNAYGITCDEGDYNFNKVYDNLSKNIPVLITAYSGKKKEGIWPFRQTVYTGGHAWVIDGYRNKQITYTYLYEWELVKENNDIYDPQSPYYDGLDKNDGPVEMIPMGKKEETTRTTTTTYLIMNWGWDGSYDSGEYSADASSVWKGGSSDYQYKKRIFSNFR